MSRRKKGNKGKSSIMLLISFCDFISSAILYFFYFFYFCRTLKLFLCFLWFLCDLFFVFLDVEFLGLKIKVWLFGEAECFSWHVSCFSMLDVLSWDFGKFPWRLRQIFAECFSLSQCKVTTSRSCVEKIWKDLKRFEKIICIIHLFLATLYINNRTYEKRI